MNLGLSAWKRGVFCQRDSTEGSPEEISYQGRPTPVEPGKKTLEGFSERAKQAPKG